MKTSEIKFSVTLDENNLPIDITWEAPDQKEKGECKSVLISIWDKNEKNTLKIDLWTKDMTVDEMKIFFHQSLLSMSNTLEKSTSEKETAEQMREFCQNFAQKFNLLKN
jgi:gliding motility-associated protein GldC